MDLTLLADERLDSLVPAIQEGVNDGMNQKRGILYLYHGSLDAFPCLIELNVLYLCCFH